MIRVLLFLLMLPVAHSTGAQQDSVPLVEDAAGVGRTVDDRDFRDTSAYIFPALSRTVRDMQHLAYALQLRDYCADDRVSDEFVRVQLARFSLLTGREETCGSLKDY